MNEQTEQLVALQVIDLDIDQIDNEIKQEQEVLDKRISALADREAHINELDEKVDTLEKERRTLEDEMSDKIANVKERQSKMMQVQTAREQSALLKEIEDGKIENAVLHLQNLATNLFSQGERQLAETVLREAENVQWEHKLSEAGKKEIKYATRALLLPAYTPLE